MARIWNTPVFILATVYFVVDVVSSHVTQPITAWLAKKKLFERVRLWVLSLGPYPSLVGVFDRNRSFLRWCRHLHHGGSFEAYIRRAAVSA
jgi:hypothetical protein